MTHISFRTSKRSVNTEIYRYCYWAPTKRKKENLPQPLNVVTSTGCHTQPMPRWWKVFLFDSPPFFKNERQGVDSFTDLDRLVSFSLLSARVKFISCFSKEKNTVSLSFERTTAKQTKKKRKGKVFFWLPSSSAQRVNVPGIVCFRQLACSVHMNWGQ